MVPALVTDPAMHQRGELSRDGEPETERLGRPDGVAKVLVGREGKLTDL